MGESSSRKPTILILTGRNHNVLSILKINAFVCCVAVIIKCILLNNFRVVLLNNYLFYIRILTVLFICSNYILCIINLHFMCIINYVQLQIYLEKINDGRRSTDVLECAFRLKKVGDHWRRSTP